MSEQIGERIRSLRKNKGMTQVQLAMKTFISESYLALIEQNKRNPSIDVIIEIAKVLGVSSDYLLFGDNAKDETVLFTQWQQLMHERSPQEIEAAHNMVKAFFDNLDKIKNSRH